MTEEIRSSASKRKMSVSSPSSLSPAKQVRFQDLMNSGKEFVKDGKVKEGLEAMKEALTICRTKKLLSRIAKCEEYLRNCEEEEEEEADDNMIEVCKGFSLTGEIHEKLYPYQREGIAWMFKLYRQQKGGVLGDDMGLGKTIQIIGFLSGMFQADLIRNALIIMPVSLLPNWKQEFNKWCPDLMLCVFHGGSKKERERNLYKIQRRGGVLITSYGLIVSNEESFKTFNGRDFIWDYIILDEGHKIKNPTKTTKAVHNLASKNRIILTGTPIQNNLEELWALYDFAHQGTLLGSRQTFKMQYENPITHARAKNATIGERKLGTEIAHNLRKLIEPYFLRRTKEEVLKGSENKENIDISEVDQLSDKMKNMKLSTLARKNDLIVWTFLSDVQYKIYSGFLQSEDVKNILMTNKSPLVQLTVLKKICDHPRLLSNRSGFQFLINDDAGEDDVEKQFEEEVEATVVSIENVSDEELIAESGKMGVLIQLLENLKSEGHRTLVFSLSRKILDIIQKILRNRSWKVLRIDGTITKIEERAKRVNLFQTDSSYPILLLTTQVGGVGLTLTAADRVVIYDPSWNPSTDAQAVDRVYRIGQSKNVVVYRFITCGTVEEKIYRRQIFKDSIIKQATGDSKDPYRYFTHQELYELFTVDNVRYSATQVQLAEMHSQQRKSDTSLDEHIAYLHSLDIFGISDHDLMFTRNVKDETEDNDENVVCEAYIKKRVEQAQHMVQVEANLVQEDLRRAGTYSRPYSVTVPLSRKPSEKDNYKPPNFPDDTSQAFTGKDNMLGPFGDLRPDINMLNAEDIQSISIQSSSRFKSPPPTRAAKDKVPLLSENASILNEESIEIDEIKKVDEFEIEDVNSPFASRTPRRALFQEEVVDLVTPNPLLRVAHKKQIEKCSQICSPRLSDFSKSLEKIHNSTAIETKDSSADFGQAKSNRSKMFLLGAKGQTNDSNNFVTSADNSAEIIASDSDDECKSPVLSKKMFPFDTLRGSTRKSKSSCLGTATRPVSVIEDSMTNESNASGILPDGTEMLHEPKPSSVCKSLMGQYPLPQITVQPISAVPEHLTGNVSMKESEQKVIFSPRSVEKATDEHTAVSRLWRFEEMHKALSKSCEAAQSKKNMPNSSKMSTSFGAGYTGSLNKINDKTPVVKVSTPCSNAEVKSEFESIPVNKVSTPQTDAHLGGAPSPAYRQKFEKKFAPEEEANNGSDLAACEYGSPRRITPLKVPTKSATPVKLSPFAKAVASSPVITSRRHSKTPGSKSKKGETSVSSNKSELNETGRAMSFKNVLSDLSAHDCADDSPIVMARNKKKCSRKMIASDSDSDADEAPPESKHSTGSHADRAPPESEHSTGSEDCGAEEPTDSEHSTDVGESDASNSSDSEHSSESGDSDAGSMKDFVVSDDGNDEGEQNSLSEEDTDYEEESDYDDTESE